MAHEITSPKSQPQFSLTMMRQYSRVAYRVDKSTIFGIQVLCGVYLSILEGVPTKPSYVWADNEMAIR